MVTVKGNAGMHLKGRLPRAVQGPQAPQEAKAAACSQARLPRLTGSRWGARAAGRGALQGAWCSHLTSLIKEMFCPTLAVQGPWQRGATPASPYPGVGVSSRQAQ